MVKHTEEFAHGQARVLSNTTYLLAANLIQKFISLGYFVYYVRILGPSGTGSFDPSRTLIPISLVIIDLSLTTVLTREIARAPQRALEYTSNVLSVKILMGFLVLLAGLAVNAFYPFDQLTRTLLFLAGIVVSLDMFTTTYTALFRGLQIFRYEAIGVVITSLMTVIVGVTAFSLHAGIPGFMIAYIGGSVVNLTFMLTMVRKKLHTFPRLTWNSVVIKKFLTISLPILGAALIAKLYTYSDRYLLLKNAGKTAYGLYIAANKIPFALEFIAASFAASLLPAFSSYFMTDKDKLSRMLEQAFRYLIMVSVPLAIGVFALAHPFATKLFGKSYSEAIVALRIMICALPLVFLNFPVGSFLNATNRQIWNTVNLGIAVIVSIVLNVVLQPRFSYNGAAIAVLASYTVLFTLGIFQVRRVTILSARNIGLPLMKTVFASAIMAVPLVLLQNTFSPYFLVIPAGMIYIAALFMLGELRVRDLRLIISALGRRGT